MNFLILNRANAKKHIPLEPYIHISVRSPGSKPIKLMPSDLRKGALHIMFSDVDIKAEYPLDDGETEIVYFTKEMAQLILEFVVEHMFDVNLIVVNCVAGISRSAGIVAAFTNLMGQDDSMIFKTHRPNMLVYRTILTEAMGEHFSGKDSDNYNDI